MGGKLLACGSFWLLAQKIRNISLSVCKMIFCPCAGHAFTFLLDQKSKQKSQVKTNGLPALPAVKKC